MKQPFSLRTQFATQELAHEVDKLKDIISQVNEMSETQRTASKAFFARTLELNRHRCNFSHPWSELLLIVLVFSDDLKKKQAEIHAHYSEWKQDVPDSLLQCTQLGDFFFAQLLRQSQEERASNLSAPSVRKRKVRSFDVTFSGVS